MSEQKNLKISSEVHRLLKIKAAEQGVKIHELAEMYILACLHGTAAQEEYMRRLENGKPKA